MSAFNNHLHYSVDVLEHIVVPKSQNTETLSAQPSVTLSIMIQFWSVLAAINFYDESFLQTHKIDDVIPQRLLAPKFVTIHLPETKPLP